MAIKILLDEITDRECFSPIQEPNVAVITGAVTTFQAFRGGKGCLCGPGRPGLTGVKSSLIGETLICQRDSKKSI